MVSRATADPFFATPADLSVMCEKPLTPTSQEAEELFKIAKANNRILGVYQNRRWDGDFLTIQKLIKDGTVRTYFWYCKLMLTAIAWPNHGLDILL